MFQESRGKEFSVKEFDMTLKQWQTIPSPSEQQSKVDRRTVDGKIKTAAFAFLDAPVGAAELKYKSGWILDSVFGAIGWALGLLCLLILTIKR
jgi:hypothetical protein